jgi:hypothetical protein
MPYNPGQPRIPAGYFGRGRWTDGDHWQPRTSQADDPRVILARGPAPQATLARPLAPVRQPQSAAPYLQPPSGTPSSTPGRPGLRAPGEQDPALPLMPGSPPQLTAPGSPLLWDPSPLRDPTMPGRPHSPLQEVDRLSHQLYWYATLSAGNNADRRVALVLDRAPYEKNPKDPTSLLKTFTSEQLGQICKYLGTVQDLTDTAMRSVMKSYGQIYTPQKIGTAVHWEVKEEIENPSRYHNRIPSMPRDLFAEISFMKTLFATGQLPLQRDINGIPYHPRVPYGRRGSIRIDALESRDGETVCVYDIKTGFSQLSPARMWELAAAIFSKFPNAKRIFVTEVRPL